MRKLSQIHRTFVCTAIMLICFVAVAEENDGRGTELVFKDGTRLEVESIYRADDRLVVRFPNGRTSMYSADEIDFEASRGVPEIKPSEPKPKPPARTGNNSLNAYASTVKLKGKRNENDKIVIDTAARASNITFLETTVAEPPTKSVVGRAETKVNPGFERVRSGLRSLKSNWRRFQRAMHEVRADCSGYRRARRSSRGSYTVSGRQTAECQDATRRARQRLPMLENQYAEICDTARRNGLTPGDLRDLLNQSGMGDFDSMIDDTRDHLDAIQEGIEQ